MVLEDAWVCRLRAVRDITMTTCPTWYTLGQKGPY